jgi:hypothetical protein
MTADLTPDLHAEALALCEAIERNVIALRGTNGNLPPEVEVAYYDLRAALAARLAIPSESFEDCIRRIAEPMDAKAKAFAERLLAAVAPAPTDEAVARELVFLWGCVVGTTEPSTAARRENESALVWVRAVNAARERARGKR